MHTLWSKRWRSAFLAVASLACWLSGCSDGEGVDCVAGRGCTVSTQECAIAEDCYDRSGCVTPACEESFCVFYHNDNGLACGDQGTCMAGRCDGETAQCGNGFKATTEGCDDGNPDNGDGCDSQCKLENGEMCVEAEANSCQGVCDLLDSNTCEPANTCGNGTMDANEKCDDGNNLDNDGCGANCKLENGANCSAFDDCESGVCDMLESDQCESADTCGNGVLETGEGCDDGGTTGGDGCNRQCKIENGGVCATNDGCASGFCAETCLGPARYTKAENAEAGDAFGSSVSASGRRVVVGAPLEDSNAVGIDDDPDNNNLPDSGAVYVYEQNASGGWMPPIYVKAKDNTESLSFGSSVSIDGDFLVVGAPGWGNGQGAAYVFRFEGNSLSEMTVLKAGNPDPGDAFGSSVAISGNRIIVGAPHEASDGILINSPAFGSNASTNSGAAYIFDLVGGFWQQQAYVKASNTDAGDAFGTSVAVDGDTVVVGAPGEDSCAMGVNGQESMNSFCEQTGAVYVYTLDTGTWKKTAYLKQNNPDMNIDNDGFGASVAMDRNTIVAGAPGEDGCAAGGNGCVDNGAVYAFERDGSNNWKGPTYVKAPNASPSPDAFGTSLDIHNNTLVVGAPDENGCATGINGDASDLNCWDAGAIHVFTRDAADATSWLPTAYLKPLSENPRTTSANSGDFLGASVCVTDNFIAAGSTHENGCAMGGTGCNDAGAVLIWSAL